MSHLSFSTTVVLRPFAIILAAGLCLTPASIFAQSPSPHASVTRAGHTPDADLPIRRITLYRSGVGAFERRGLIEGDNKVQLRFNTDQINDILKSMVVLDLSKGKGQIEGVSYSSKEPLSRRLSSFGVNISDNPSAGEILNRLRGTKVKIKAPSGESSGTIMNVEKKPTILPGANAAPPQVVDLPWINLVTDQGIKSVNLTESTGFEILDAALADELNKALAALAEYRAERTKTVDINLRGLGAREIVVAYVQETPVWKPSYRLILPEPSKRTTPPAGTGQDAHDAAKGEALTIQGWAIVENTTDEDWTNVRLALVSGRPVSFTMDLYEPLYVARPSVPVPTVPGVAPRSYAGGQSPSEPSGDSATEFEAQSILRARSASAPGSPAPAMKPAGGLDAGEYRRSAGRKDQADKNYAKAISAEDMAGYAAKAQAQAIEVGEVFQYELEAPVSVERQRSAMLPILSSALDGRRVSIYNASDNSEHPMRGVWITNSTNLQLMPGPISVFDNGAYAGDAQIGHVPAGDKRLLAYAVDLDVSARQESEDKGITRKVRIVRGLLEQTILRRVTNSYFFDNKDKNRDRAIIVEQPKISGWKLAAPDKPLEQTEGIYRFEVHVDAGKAAKLAVTQETTSLSSYTLLSQSMPTLLQFQKDGVASQGVIDAFKEAAKKQATIADTQRKIADLDNERKAIDTDQGRIRSNMNTIDRQSDLYARYMKKLTEQETKLEDMAKTIDTLRAQLESQQRDLDAFLASLNVE